MFIRFGSIGRGILPLIERHINYDTAQTLLSSNHLLSLHTSSKSTASSTYNLLSRKTTTRKSSRECCSHIMARRAWSSISVSMSTSSMSWRCYMVLPSPTLTMSLNPARRIPTVGIVRKVLSTQTQLSHKHHHHGGAICPSYCVVSLDTPDWTRATSLEGVGQKRFLAWFSIKR